MADNAAELAELAKRLKEVETSNIASSESGKALIAVLKNEEAAIKAGNTVLAARLKTIEELYTKQLELEKLEKEINNGSAGRLQNGIKRFELEKQQLEQSKKLLDLARQKKDLDPQELKNLEEINSKLELRTKSQENVNASVKGFQERMLGASGGMAGFISNVATSSGGLSALGATLFSTSSLVIGLGNALVNLGVQIIDKVVIASFRRAIEITKLLAETTKEGIIITNEYAKALSENAKAIDLVVNSAAGYKSSLQTLGIFEEQRIKAQKDLALNSAIAREAFNNYRATLDPFTTELQATTAQMEKLQLSGGETAKLIDTFVISIGAANKSSESINKSLQGFTEQAYKIGIPLKTFASDFISAMNTLAAQGNKAMEVFLGLEKRSKTLGVEMNTLLGIVGKFDTFEGAADAAGSLNAILGGDYLNSIQMLNASEEQRVDLIRQSLEASGRSFGALDKYQQKAIASALGISNLNDANKIFSNTTGESSAQQQKFAEIMEKTTGVAEKFENGIKKLASGFAPFLDILEGIADAFSKFTDMIARNPYAAVALAVVAIASGFAVLYFAAKQTVDAFSAFKKVINEVNNGLVEQVKTAAAAATSLSVLDRVTPRGGERPEVPTSIKLPESPEEAGAEGASKLAEAAESVPEDKGKGLVEFFENIHKALEKIEFKDIGKVAFLALIGAGIGAALAGILIVIEKYAGGVQNAIMLVPVAVAIYLFAMGMKQVADVNLNMGNAIKFSAAMLILAGGIALMGLAIQQFKGIDLATLGIIGLAVTELAALAFALGALVSNPLGVVLFGAGVAALIVLALSLKLLGMELKPLAESIKSVNESLSGNFSEKIQNFSTGLGTLATLITVKISDSMVKKLSDLGGAFRIFGVGITQSNEQMSAFLTSFDNFTEKLSASSEKINNVAINLTNLSSAINLFATSQSGLATAVEQFNTTFESFSDEGLSKLAEYSRSIGEIGNALYNLPTENLAAIGDLKLTGDQKTIFGEINLVEREKLEAASSTLKEASSYAINMAFVAKYGETMDRITKAITGVLGGGSKEDNKVIQINLMLDGKQIKSVLTDTKGNVLNNNAAEQLSTGVR